MTTMKLEQETVAVLKHFSTINPSLLFKPGNVLTTVSTTKSVLARAKIKQNFDRQFAIQDISRLLGAMSLFENPSLKFNDKSLTITGTDRELEYSFAEPAIIITPPEKGVIQIQEDVGFHITQSNLQDIQKALNALGMSEVAVIGDGSKLFIAALDPTRKIQDTFKIVIGETDKKFKFVFKAENLKLIPQDYDVKVTSKGISHFKSTSSVDVEYWVTLEAKSSTYEG